MRCPTDINLLMIFNSFQFIWLFPIIFGVYMVILNYTGKHSIKIANYFLLSSSYALYAQHNPFALFVLLFVTFVTYFGARLIENFRQYKKALIYGLVTLALTPLFFYKYYDFFKQVVMDAMGGEFVGEQ